MYGDTGVIRRLAGDMRDQAAELRREADRLVASAESVAWRGPAADAMRGRLRENAGDLRATANAHDEAAAALLKHAAEVDRLKELIASIESRVRGMIADARSRLGAVAAKIASGVEGILPDPVDKLLDAFTPPPSGHKAWLDIDLPGVDR